MSRGYDAYAFNEAIADGPFGDTASRRHQQPQSSEAQRISAFNEAIADGPFGDTTELPSSRRRQQPQSSNAFLGDPAAHRVRSFNQAVADGPFGDTTELRDVRRRQPQPPPAKGLRQLISINPNLSDQAREEIRKLNAQIKEIEDGCVKSQRRVEINKKREELYESWKTNYNEDLQGGGYFDF